MNRSRTNQGADARSRTRIPGALLFSAVVASCIAAAAFIGFGPVLKVDQVHVNGYDGPRAEAVTRSLAAIGRTGTAFLSPEEMIREYSRRTPTIKDVQVERDGLTGLMISVTTRHPVARESGDVVITDDGVRLRGVSSRGLAQLHPSGDLGRKDVRELLIALDQLSPSLRGRIRDAGIPGQSLGGRLASGTQIRFGQPVRMKDKGLALDAVWKKHRRLVESARYIDMVVPDRVVIGPPRES